MGSAACSMGRNALNLKNRKFARLSVVKSIASNRKGINVWLCKCDCGKNASYTTDHLTRKKNPVKSCGCIRKLSGARHKDWKGYGGISGAWWRLHVSREKYQTARVKVPFSITIQYAWRLFVKQNKKCALTGIELRFSSRPEDNTASVDRIDSSIGYVKGNVQWVHKHVNFMKRTYSQEYFIEMCKLVAYNGVV